MTGIRDLGERRPRNRIRNLARECRRGRLVERAAQHQGRIADAHDVASQVELCQRQTCPCEALRIGHGEALLAQRDYLRKLLTADDLPRAGHAMKRVLTVLKVLRRKR